LVFGLQHGGRSLTTNSIETRASDDVGTFLRWIIRPGDSRLCPDLREVDLRHIRKILLANQIA